MIKTKGNGNLIVVSGPSGSGKGTIINKVLNNSKNIWFSISMTTREIREGEVDGKDYFFVTREEFEKRIKEDKFLEYTEYNGNYYGTPKDKIEDKLNDGNDVILEIEINGALQVKEIINDAIFIFILPPSMKELKRRLENRGTETKEKQLARFKKAYNEINELTKYNYVVVNDDVEKAVEKVNAILLSEKCRVDRIEEIYVDSIEEVLHEELVDKDLLNEERDI